MKPHDVERLRHMLDAAIEAREILSAHTVADLQANRPLALALVKLIEIVGEAAANVSEAKRDEIPEIPWQDVVAMRHRLIHGYYDVDVAVVTQTIREDFPGVIEVLSKILGAPTARS